MAANPQNLKPNSARTPEERTELARKAGKASGAARRQKRDVQKMAEMVLTAQAVGGGAEYLRTIGFPDEYSTQLVAIIQRMSNKAQSGDVNAARFCIDCLEGTTQHKKKIEEERLAIEKERLELEKLRHEEEVGSQESAANYVKEWFEAVIEASDDGTSGDTNE